LFGKRIYNNLGIICSISSWSGLYIFAI
jgi:hypothetical protein